MSKPKPPRSINENLLGKKVFVDVIKFGSLDEVILDYLGVSQIQ